MLVGELKHPMGIRILGIESSCDETAAAVVIDGGEILSSVVASQIDIHRKYGGGGTRAGGTGKFWRNLAGGGRGARAAQRKFWGGEGGCVVQGPRAGGR